VKILSDHKMIMQNEKRSRWPYIVHIAAILFKATQKQEMGNAHKPGFKLIICNQGSICIINT